MRPLRVFLCHSAKDKAAVRELYQTLRSEAWIDPWLDEEKLLPGQDWHEEIEKAVEGTDVVIVLLSKQSVSQEGYVQRELKLALDVADEKPENTIFIIPLRLDDCPAPRRLRGWHYVDYFPASRKPWVIERLLSSLKVRAETLGIKVAEREKPKKEPPVSPQEEKAPEVKVVSRKPFTKLLEPSALSPKQTPPVGRVSNPTKPIAPKKLAYGFWGIGLLALILVGIGLNSLLKNPPVATATDSPTPKPPTFTSVPFTKTPTPTKTTIPTPTLGIGSTMTGEKGETLVYVPAGEFTMGSENGNDDEKPVHTVYLDAFWIDQTEVTNKQYQACVDAGTCEPPSSSSSYSHPSYYGNSEFDSYPVLNVNWDKANRYCEVWAGGDLPTEAQWEKAASWDEDNQTKRVYPWGNGFDGMKVNFCDKNCAFDWADKNVDDRYAETAPVGSFPDGRSPYEVYDMAGNVWEWVNDYYQSDYYAALGNSASNPVGPESGENRVLRGGSWNDFDNLVRSALRYWNDPTVTSYNFGFRCARSFP
jgi:formylglycine-generating enzyme required for sulfatase activity